MAGRLVNSNKDGHRKGKRRGNIIKLSDLGFERRLVVGF